MVASVLRVVALGMLGTAIPPGVVGPDRLVPGRSAPLRPGLLAVPGIEAVKQAVTSKSTVSG